MRARTSLLRVHPARQSVTQHSVCRGPSAAKRALGTVQMTSRTAASSYQQQMGELRRTLMAQVLVRAVSARCVRSRPPHAAGFERRWLCHLLQGDDAAEQSLDSDEQREEQRELAALMKELQTNPFVHRKGPPTAAHAVDDAAVVRADAARRFWALVRREEAGAGSGESCTT